MRSLRLPFGDVEPSVEEVKEVDNISRGFYNLGHIKDYPTASKVRDSLGWYILIECNDEDYASWYAYYWGFMLGRKLNAVPTQSR